MNKVDTSYPSYNDKSYASGTAYHPSGLAMVGENGPELVSLPRDSRVHINS